VAGEYVHWVILKVENGKKPSFRNCFDPFVGQLSQFIKSSLGAELEIKNGVILNKVEPFLSFLKFVSKQHVLQKI
jgi:hypothetical protein